jgi:hypothetical protein
LHQEQIARSCSIGQSTVHRYLERAEAAQLVWPLAEDWDDAKIEQLLFPVKVGFKAAASAPIDFAGIHQELVTPPLADQERRDFLEICEERYDFRSTILTSQVPVAKWHAQVGDPTLADSILDRLVHNAYRIDLTGGSIRKIKSRKPDGTEGTDKP